MRQFFMAFTKTASSKKIPAIFQIAGIFKFWGG
jgi:hypothetical protein